MCRILGISESGYHAWRKRPPSRRAQANARLEVEIKAAHERTRQTYGPERLQADLADNGILVGIHRIKRIRSKLGLRCRQKRKFKATTDSKHNLPVAPNLLDRQFAVTAPNKAWVTDITYIATDEGWLYLAGIKDLFNGELVGYALDARMTQQLVMRPLSGSSRQAAWQGVAPPLGSRQPVLRPCLPEAPAAVRYASLDESQGQLLGQRTDGKLLGFPENRIGASLSLRDPRAGQARDHRIHRDLLQPHPKAGSTRPSVARRFQSAILCNANGRLTRWTLRFATDLNGGQADAQLFAIWQVSAWSSPLTVSYLLGTNSRFWPILLKNSLDKPLAYRRNAIFFRF
jgi:hypothetical protein